MDRPMLFACILLLAFGIFTLVASLDVDPNGYILFCPCMGRFGNQADQFLGAMAFVKSLNRTMVLPPWVEYRSHVVGSVQVPFKTYFKVTRIQQYHRAITMETFMDKLAPTIWPPSERHVYCHSSRHGGKQADCNAKEGSPFGPFWNTYNVDFVKSHFYGSYKLDFTASETSTQRWTKQYPPEMHPVLAFTGSPGAFPALQQNEHLQKYLVWSNDINGKADSFIHDMMDDQPFLGIHMRHGSDWANACVHIDSTRQLFASAQCLGYDMEHGKVTKELCLPSTDTVLKQVKATIKKMKVSYLFVASDADLMIGKFTQLLKQQKVTVVHFSPSNPHVDLAILGKAKHYIGNCVSTFSVFATRERRVSKKSCSFWAFPDGTVHSEL